MPVQDNLHAFCLMAPWPLDLPSELALTLACWTGAGSGAAGASSAAAALTACTAGFVVFDLPEEAAAAAAAAADSATARLLAASFQEGLGATAAIAAQTGGEGLRSGEIVTV